jgi:hypothetical protein
MSSWHPVERRRIVSDERVDKKRVESRVEPDFEGHKLEQGAEDRVDAGRAETDPERVESKTEEDDFEGHKLEANRHEVGRVEGDRVDVSRVEP